jgi:flagellar hook capping protein FlgD
MKRFVILGLIAALPLAGPSRAGTPLPTPSQVDSCIVTCPAGDSIFTVVVHQWNGQPVVGGDVVLDFEFCPNIHLASSNPPGLYEVEPTVVLSFTNALGQVDIPLAAGGACANLIRVYCSGQLLRSRPVASFDQDGDLAVTVADLALVDAKIGTSDRTADYNCDGAVTAADYDIAVAHLGHAHPSVVGVGAAAAVAFGVRATPNPSRGAVDFLLRLPAAGRAVLAIHDLSGRRLATVLDREIEPGVQHVAWSGRDDAGRAVASGVYHYRLTVGARQAQGSLIVTR